MKFRYRYYILQEDLISILQDTEVKFRIKKDRTIEFAEKWYQRIHDEINEIRFEIFNKPCITEWDEEENISKMLHKLAEKNIPFIVENHNGLEFIIYDYIDSREIGRIMNELNLF